ncbi:MAG: hypothetical protein LUD22_04575 [Coprobacillus sp.]|nr:hypothetical protein [Coprobacillus sp.]
MALSSIQSSGCLSVEESNFEESFYSYQTAILNDNTFEFSQKYDYEIGTYSFESNDFEIVGTTIFKNKIWLDLLSKREQDFSHFTLLVYFTNGLYEFDSYYVYINDNSLFISSSSDEEAWFLWAKQVYKNNLYSAAELQDIYHYYSSIFLDENDNVRNFSISHDGGSYGTCPTTVVCGSLSFTETDSTFGTQCNHPLKEVKVSLCVDGSESFSDGPLSTYTSEDGSFKFILDKGNYPSLYNSSFHNYSVIFYSQGQTYKLVNRLSSLYSYESQTLYNQQNETTIDLEETVILYDKTQNTKAFSICCALGYAEEFILNYSKFPSSYDTIIYRYPAWLDTSWTYNLHGAFVDDKASEYSTIIHEYGHYVAQTMGIFGRKWYQAIGNNGMHDETQDNFDSGLNKNVAMMKTWDESVADIFAMLVCSHYDDLMDSNCHFASGIRSLINSSNWLTGFDECSGEAQQHSVTSYLWNLYSNANKCEQINLSEKQFLDVLLVEGTYTLSTFIDIFTSTYPEYAFQSGSLLEICCIGPKITAASYSNVTKEFCISFIPNGSSVKPNNSFNVLFYSENYSLIGSISNIQPEVGSGREEITYSISKLVIAQSILSSFNSTIYVSLEGYQDDSPVSGPYCSGLFSFEISTGVIGKVIV